MAQEFKPVFTGASEFDRAVAGHAGKEPAPVYADLPGGINNGIAQLTSCYFGIIKDGDDKGKKFFRASATVVEPHEVVVDGKPIPIFGLHTSIMWTIKDSTRQDGTAVPASAVIERIMDTIARLGGGKQFTAAVRTAADLEKRCKMLVQMRPCVRFATRQGKKTEKYPNPRVFHEWYDRVPDPRATQQRNGSTATGVADSTQDTSDDQPDADPAPSRQTVASRDRLSPDDTNTTTTFNEFNEDEVNLDDLASQAMGGDADAGEKLQQIARQVGIDEDTIQHDDVSWPRLAELIKVRRDGEGSAAALTAGDDPDDDDDEPEEEPEVTPPEPAVGQTVKYRVLRDGKPETNAKGQVKRPIDCKIVKVNKAKKHADLKEIGGERTFRLVPWNELLVE